MCLTLAWRESPTTQPDNSAIRDYLSANGLANRGLYEMAAEDYRKFLAAHADAEQAPAARYGLAVCLMRMGKTDNAADELAQLDRRPQFNFSIEVTTLLGQCRLLQKRYADATTLLSRVVEKHGDHELADDAAALRIEASHRDEKFDDAKKFHDSFVARWPKSALRPRAEYFGGLARMALRDYPKAAECFLRLTKDAPNDPLAREASLLLAQCLQDGDASDGAIVQYREILKSADGPQVPDAMHGLASLLLRKGQADEAGKLLDQFLERFGKHPLASSARILRGRALFEQEKFDLAETAFNDARKQDIDPALADDAVYWIAKCRLRNNDAKSSASMLAEAIEQYPQSDLLAEMIYDRAVALSRAGDDRAAASALSEFPAKFAAHALLPDALYLLAACAQRTGDFNASRLHCDAFTRQFPKHALIAEISFLAAENHFLEGKYEPAVAAYRGLLDSTGDETRSRIIRLRLGTALFRLKRPTEASKVLAEATAGASDDEVRPGLLMLGDIAFEQSQWSDAAAHYARYLGSNMELPAADDVLLKLGLAEQRQGHHEAALKAFDRLLEHFPNSSQRAQAQFERGQSLVALKQPEDAARAFERVLEEGRDSRFAPYALTHLGTIAQQQGRLDDAAKRFDEAARAAPQGEVGADAALQSALSMLAAEKYGDAEKALAAFLDANSSHSRAGEAKARRAIALARSNRAADAIKEIDKIDIDGAARLDPHLLETLRYEKAWCLRSTDRERDAIPIYKSLLDASDATLAAQAALELADIEMRGKRFAAAAELLSRIKPDNSNAALAEQATYRLAVCSYEQGHFAEAAEQFSNYLKAYPKGEQIASANALCGEALVKSGQPGPAVAKLRRVTEHHADDPACGPALLRLGETLATLQRWPESRQAFADFLERFGSSELAFQAQFGIGWAEENQNRHDEAMKAYRAVVDKHKGPTAARAQFQIGECLFAKKEYEAAARELLKVDILYNYPEWSAAALYEAGRCFEKMERPSDARTQFAQVVEKYTDTRWSALARQRLSAAPLATALPGKDASKSTE